MAKHHKNITRTQVRLVAKRQPTVTKPRGTVADLIAYLETVPPCEPNPQWPKIGPYELAHGWAGTGGGKLCPACDEFIDTLPAIVLPGSLSEDLYLHPSCAEGWASRMSELTAQV